MITLLVLILFTVSGFLMPYQPYLDIFNNLRLQIIVLTLIILLLAVLIGAESCTFWSALLLLINVALAGVSFYFVAPSAPAASPFLRVMSFNIGKNSGNLSQIEATLREENADLIFLSEFRNQEEGLLDRLANLYPYQVACPQDYLCQIAILSKYQLQNARLNNRTFGIPSNITAYLNIDNQEINVIGVYLSRPTESNQKQEISYLINEMFRKGESVIMLGNFALSSWSWDLLRLQEKTGLLRHRTLGANWPGNAWFFPWSFLVDHIMTRGPFRTRRAYTGHKTEAKHLPVIVDLAGS